MAQDSSGSWLRAMAVRNPVLVSVLIGFAATLVVAGLSFTDTFKALELQTYDLRLKHLPSIAMSDSIVMLDIDDASIEALEQWPFARSLHATVVDVLTKAGAKAIVFDVEFLDPSRPSAEPGQLSALEQAIAKLPGRKAQMREVKRVVIDHDAVFAKALGRSNVVYVPFSLDTTHIYSPEVEAWYRRAKPILLEDIETDAATMAKQIDVAPEVIAGEEVSLKRRVVLEFLKVHAPDGNIKPDDVCAALIPNYRPSHQSPETEIIKSEYARYLAMLRIRKLAGLRPKASQTDGLVCWRELKPPLLPFARNIQHTGYVNVEPDRQDGTLRRVRLAAIHDGRVYLQLALRVALDYLGVSMDSVQIHPKSLCYRMGDRTVEIPTNREGMALVNWAGDSKGDWHKTFTHVPFAKVIDMDEDIRIIQNRLDKNMEAMDARYFHGRRARLIADPNSTTEQIAAVEKELVKFLQGCVAGGRRQLAKTKDPKRAAAMETQIDEIERQLNIIDTQMNKRKQMTDWLRHTFAGKICIIGDTARSSTDLNPTPLNPRQPMVTLHANVANMVFQRHFLRDNPPWLNVLLILTWGLTSTLAAARGNAKDNTIETFLLIGANFAAAFGLFSWVGVNIVLMGSLAAQVLSYAAVTTFRQLTEERSKRQIRHAFEHYLSPEVVRQVAEDPAKLQLGGEMRELTVLFSDIQGFSTVSESMSPPDLVEWLNEYLGEMSQTIIDNGGVVDKYEGDLIMAFFGAPLDMPDHAARACLTMLENRDKLDKLRIQWNARGLPPIYARVGMNSDRVLVGNLGSRNRLNYSVIGDGVNLAARLEPANKIYGTYLMVAEATYQQAKHVIVGRELDLIRVVGKAKPMRVYELIGRQGHVPEEKLKGLGLFADGLAFYRERKWEQAIDAFKRVFEHIPDDPPAKSFVARCIEYMDSPPPEDWAGVFQQTSKE